MPERILTLRELNRTHLRRQHLLERTPMSTGDMLRAIVGLQAQEVKDPYLALWSRIEGLQHDYLADMLLNRSAVRASLMRGTIHLVTAEDYLLLFPITYALHLRAVKSVASARLVPSEHHQKITEFSRELLTGTSLTAAKLGEALAEHWPQYDPRSLSQVVRFLLPLVQTPPRGVWGSGISSRPSWTMPHDWLNTDVQEAVGPAHEMIRRYLRAFGPASLPDITAWSGVTNLKQPIKELASELVTYRDESGVVLYDLAELDIASSELEAPVRFLPGFDNALLGHKDRSRIISSENRLFITTPNGMFARTFLVDGFVAGIWRDIEDRIELAPLQELSKSQKHDIQQEAERMAPFWTGEERPAVWTEPWKSAGK